MMVNRFLSYLVTPPDQDTSSLLEAALNKPFVLTPICGGGDGDAQKVSVYLAGSSSASGTDDPTRTPPFVVLKKSRENPAITYYDGGHLNTNEVLHFACRAGAADGLEAQERAGLLKQLVRGFVLEQLALIGIDPTVVMRSGLTDPDTGFSTGGMETIQNFYFLDLPDDPDMGLGAGDNGPYPYVSTAYGKFQIWVNVRYQ